MMAVSAVLDVIEIVSGLFAQQAEALRASHVELLFAPCEQKKICGLIDKGFVGRSAFVENI